MDTEREVTLSDRPDCSFCRRSIFAGEHGFIAIAGDDDSICCSEGCAWEAQESIIDGPSFDEVRNAAADWSACTHEQRSLACGVAVALAAKAASLREIANDLIENYDEGLHAHQAGKQIIGAIEGRKVSFFNEFPEIEIPQALLDLGFIDISWHNDAGARMIHKAQENYGGTKPIFTIFIGDDATQEEVGQKHLCGLWIDGSYEEDPEFNYSGDDLDEIISRAKLFIEKRLDLQGTDGLPSFPEYDESKWGSFSAFCNARDEFFAKLGAK